MRPFEERYRTALGDGHVRSALLGFQRSWRETRDAQIAELEAITGRSFEQLSAELAVIRALEKLAGSAARETPGVSTEPRT